MERLTTQMMERRKLQVAAVFDEVLKAQKDDE